MKKNKSYLILVAISLLTSLTSIVSAQVTYLLTITDSTKIVAFSNTGSTASVTFSDPALNTITANYLLTRFEKAYPTSRFPHLRKVWMVSANNTVAYINQLKAADNALFPESKQYVAPVPAANYYPNDWHLWDDGYLDYIKAPGAWGITKGSPGTVIGITDTYFDLNNPDFLFKVAQSNIAGGQGSLQHGTLVAGIAAGATDNGQGYPSIGFNCRLDLSDSWGNYDKLIEMTRRGRRILNASWGGSGFYLQDQDICNEIYEDGTFFVAAAGNGWDMGINPNDYFYPASYDNVFSVGGVCWKETSGTYNRRGMHQLNTTDSSSHVQQHNDRVDLVAPSFFIGGLQSGAPWFINGFNMLSGTSFAAPQVAGTAGLMLSVNPCLSPYQLESLLKTSADTELLYYPENLKYTGKLGAGLLNAELSVKTSLEHDCNNPKTQTLYIAGVELNTLCAPGIATNGANPKLTPVIEHGTPPYTYKWEAVTANGNTCTLNDSTAATPEIIASTAGPNGHIAAFRLIVHDASKVRKVARRFFTIQLRTALEHDLAVRDSYMDMLDEPNNMHLRNERDWQLWQSPDVWVRQTADGGLEHQHPEYLNNDSNQVYTRIRNVGCRKFDPTVQGGANAELYWTKASTGENWRYDWDGSTSVAGSAGGIVPAGGRIGNGLPIPALLPGESVVLSSPWHPQQPQSYLGSPDYVDVCLLARIQEFKVLTDPLGNTLITEKPMAIAERYNQSTTYNIKSNNNIATRNFLVQNLNPRNRGGGRHIVDVANAGDVEAYFNLQLINEREINKHFAGDFSALGTIELQFGGLYSRWQDNGGVLSGNGTLTPGGGNTFTWDGTGEVTLRHIRLAPGERFPVGVIFRLKDGVKPVAGTHTFHLRQLAEGAGHDAVPDGNVTMQVAINGEDSSNGPQARGTGIAGAQKSNTAYTVFPNPASGTVYVQRLSLTNRAATVLLTDVTGRILRSAALPSGTERLSIPVSGLAAGVYMVEVKEGSADAGHYRIVVQ
jgi:hypothetical protein